MESEFSLFPEKLRVLVVDDDPVCIKVITQMLKQCNYEVTQVAKATEAVETLRKKPKGFDMVITDTYNDIDVLSLIVKIVKTENIPVILASGLEDTKTLIKGVLHGADEVISKPVSLAKLQNLWQHVYRRRRLINQKEEPSSLIPAEVGPNMEEDQSEELKTKKARLRWQGSLQDKFLQAVLQLGGPAKALPKQIMELMNVPDVSRESVASHLQKYRKQKKFLVHKNDTNGVDFPSPPSSSSSSTICCGHIFPPVSTHSCYQSNHNHRQHSGFNGPMGHSIINSMGRSNAYNSSSSFPASSPWLVPKVDPGIGVIIPAQPLSMLPPQPSQVVPPIASNNCNNNNFVRLPLPSQSHALPPPASMSTDYSNKNNNININNNNSFAFSGKPWVDSGLLDDNFFSISSKMFNHDEFSDMLELHPDEDQWILGEYQTPENGAMPIMKDYHQFGDGDGAAGSSSQRYS